jgi:hypothetical protein
MEMPNWLIGLGLLAAFSVVIVGAVGFLAHCFPEPEGNRPMPPERLADLEQARDDALAKIAARQRRRAW